mmetsp:Transcript_20043/g.47304  ORF Transcript_20043/g.47304 Transcript_20043/m.47304 type:complete len:248 (-) Transcript_20043:813-1556(-)
MTRSSAKRAFCTVTSSRCTDRKETSHRSCASLILAPPPTRASSISAPSSKSSCASARPPSCASAPSGFAAASAGRFCVRASRSSAAMTLRQMPTTSEVAAKSAARRSSAIVCSSSAAACSGSDGSWKGTSALSVRSASETTPSASLRIARCSSGSSGSSSDTCAALCASKRPRRTAASSSSSAKPTSSRDRGESVAPLTSPASTLGCSTVPAGAGRRGAALPAPSAPVLDGPPPSSLGRWVESMPQT